MYKDTPNYDVNGLLALDLGKFRFLSACCMVDLFFGGWGDFIWLLFFSIL